MTVPGDRTGAASPIRPVWRIAAFLLLFLLLNAAGALAIGPLPRSPLRWGGLLVSTLAAVLAGAIVLARIDARPPGALGFAVHRRLLDEAARGLVLGAALISAVAAVLVVTGTVRFTPDSGSAADYVSFLIWTLAYFGIAAAFEEALFRGYPFQVLVEWIGPAPAVAIGSIVFAAVHGWNPNVNVLALFNIFLAGVLLSVAYLKTFSLWFATGVHLGWNWMMASVLDFPVSGLGYDTPLYGLALRGPDVATGGAFGPEAGLPATVVLLGGTWWLVRTRRIRPSAETLALRPLAASRPIRLGRG